MSKREVDIRLKQLNRQCQNLEEQISSLESLVDGIALGGGGLNLEAASGFQFFAASSGHFHRRRFKLGHCVLKVLAPPST